MPDEALRLANDSAYGLNSSVWSADPAQAERLAAGLEAGNVCVNDVIVSYGVPALPFGGVKESGIGRVHGPEGLHEFSQVKSVLTDRFGLRPRAVVVPDAEAARAHRWAPAAAPPPARPGQQAARRCCPERRPGRVGAADRAGQRPLLRPSHGGGAGLAGGVHAGPIDLMVLDMGLDAPTASCSPARRGPGRSPSPPCRPAGWTAPGQPPAGVVLRPPLPEPAGARGDPADPLPGRRHPGATVGAPATGLDLAGNTVAAVGNTPAPTSATARWRADPGWREEGIPPAAMVFNSGVLVIDRAAWEARDTTDRVLRTARDLRGPSLWPDQASLNLARGGVAHRSALEHPRRRRRHRPLLRPQEALGPHRCPTA